ncbi:hypothetical protein [Hydrogenimonas sp.]
MERYLHALFLLLLLPLVGILIMEGCFDQKSVERQGDDAVYSFITEVKEGVLSIKEGNRSYILADDAIDYRVIPSPTGVWLAVESRPVSNLQTLRLYKKESSGRYRLQKERITQRLWERAARRLGFEIADLEPKGIDVLRWEEEGRLHINLHGELPGRRVDHNTTLILE